MGLTRMMCGRPAASFWRRNTTLCWLIIILLATAYVWYTVTYRSTSLPKISFGSLQGHKGDGFWESHGGDELQVDEGKIHILQDYAHKEVVHKGVANKEVVHKDVVHKEFANKEVTHKDVDEAIKDNHMEDVPIKQAEVDENLNIPPPVAADAGVPLEGGQQAAEHHKHNVEQIDKDNNDQENGIEQQLEQTDQSQHGKPDQSKHIVPGENRAKVDKQESAEEHKARVEAQERKIEFEKKGVDESVNKKSGVIDATLPEREVLESWEDARIEATFHNYVVVPQVSCDVIQRMGPSGHGGWDVCHADDFRPRQPCLVYSFSFKSNFQFEDDVAKRYHCETHYFDPGANGEMTSSGIALHPLGLSYGNGRSPNGWKVRTLATIRRDLSHKQDIDILKIDVEDMEWAVIPEMINSGALGSVRQLLVELHVQFKADPDASKTKYMGFLGCLRDLYIDGFRIVKTHPSEETRVSKYGNERPMNYEILFVRV